MLGLLYAFTSLYGEYVYSRSPSASSGTEALRLLDRARAVFPLDSRFRRGPAMFLTLKRWHGSRPLAEAAIRAVLATDPNDADMHIALAGLLFEDDDRDGARAELDAAHAISPLSHMHMVVNVNPATR